MTEAEESPALASLVISPNLQALLEFDDRLRTSSEILEQPETAPAELPQPSQFPSWIQQEVPTVSLPPPRRRKKSVVTGVPMSPKTISELQNVSSTANAFPGVSGLGGLGEIGFARAEDVREDVVEDERESRAKGLMNPYLNSPPSPPRYFYPRSDDEGEGVDQPSFFYTLEKSRSMRRPSRQRSSSDQSPVEHKGGRLVSPRHLASLGRNAGSRPKERGASFLCLSQPLSYSRPFKSLDHVPQGRFSRTATSLLSPLLTHTRCVPALYPAQTNIYIYRAFRP